MYEWLNAFRKCKTLFPFTLKADLSKKPTFNRTGAGIKKETFILLPFVTECYMLCITEIYFLTMLIPPLSK